MAQRLAGRQRRMVIKMTEVLYVPLLETLQNLLNNASILREVSNVLQWRPYNMNILGTSQNYSDYQSILIFLISTCI